MRFARVSRSSIVYKLHLGSFVGALIILGRIDVVPSKQASLAIFIVLNLAWL